MSSLGIDESALSILTDDELCLLHEVNALNACGYREEEIKEMLGDRWPEALMIADKVEAERQRLLRTDKRYMDLL